ncbi:MAG: flagellar biosynthesis anti-sigma factor FlgM [Sphingomonadaceae bacterium]|nr:flagellar biosynthesis anti-sigma factor FlgM [Sphingomonadaceae bacterium]
MIKSVGDKQFGRIDAPRVGLDRAGSAAKPASAGGAPAQVGAPVSPAADMAAQGAPVDGAKIAAIKAAIAEGRYPVDPTKIADAMIKFTAPGE